MTGMTWSTTVSRMVWRAAAEPEIRWTVELGGGGGGTTMPTGTAGQVPQLATGGTSYELKTPNTAGGLVRLDGSATIPDILISSSIARDTEVTAAVDAAVTALLDGAPGALDTLNELAAALNDDASFSAAVTAAFAAIRAGYLAVAVYDFDVDEYPARPDATVVRWIGPTEPPDWQGYDEWREVEPPPEVPGAPTGVAVTAGDTQVDVEWTAPASDGGSAITGYRVTPYIGATAQTATTVGVVLSTTITGLTNDTEYTFKVAAINAVGTGSDSTASDPVTPVAPPAGIAFVQRANNSSSTGTTITATLGTPATAGNLIVAVHYAEVASGAAVTSGFTMIDDETWSTTKRVAVYYKIAAGGETAIQFSSGASTGHWLEVSEFSGVATSSPVDEFTSTSTGSSVSTFTAGPTATTTQADELAFAVVATFGPVTMSNTWTNSFTAGATSWPFSQRLATAWKILEATGTPQSATTWTTARTAASIMATFKAA